VLEERRIPQEAEAALIEDASRRKNPATRPLGDLAAVLAVLLLTACQSTVAPIPTTAAPSAPAANDAAPLFYSKGGSLYVSAPAGSPGRKLTDGPIDEQPAPSPDLAHVAFVRKADASDFGGELWVLDLSAQLTPAAPPRRLVDPAGLPHARTPKAYIGLPQWSPTGGQIAFLDSPNNGFVPGGILMVATADTGVLQPRQVAPGADWAPFADPSFAWAPDGSHIAWINERSDVRPVNINALAAVGGKSTPVAKATNAFSVTYARDGQAILFLNGEAPPDSVSRPFAVHTGGLYSVATPGGVAATPPSEPVPLFTRQGSYYGHLAALESGGFAFTTQGASDESQMVQVLDEGSALPRTTVSDVAMKPVCKKTPGGGGVCHAVQSPVWGPGDLLAYLNTSPERALVVTDPDNRNPRQVDTGVDTFAWAP
jgi:TolB protein